MDLYIQIRLPRLFDAVSSVLASTEFVATKVLVSTIRLNKHWIRTDKFACQGKFPETLKEKIKTKEGLFLWKCLNLK